MKNTNPNSNKTGRESFPALLTLLQDEDDKVASLAMEQFLNSGLAEAAVAEFQEANEPKLRQRIHQLNGILHRRRVREAFLAAVASDRLGAWEGILQINQIYDPQCLAEKVTDAIHKLAAKVGREGATAARIAALMKDDEFTVPDEDLLDVNLYLAERVVESKYGSPALLCAITQYLGHEAGWNSTLVLHEGRFCLIDGRSMLIDPSQGWHVVHVNAETQLHPCTARDLWLGVLAQIFLVCLVDGNLRDLYQFGDLLAALNQGKLDDALPYPLGREGAGAQVGF